VSNYSDLDWQRFAKNHGRVWTMHNELESAMWINGHTIGAIAVKLGRLPSAVYHRLRGLGLIGEVTTYQSENQYSLLTVSNCPNSDNEVAIKEIPVYTNDHVKITHLLTLLQEGYTTVVVGVPSANKDYTYKTNIMDLAQGDLVVVPTRDTFTVGTVVKVHEKPEIDVNVPYVLKWVVSRLDLTQYNEQLAREKVAAEHFKAARRERERAEALKTLLGDTSVEELRLLLNGGAK